MSRSLLTLGLFAGLALIGCGEDAAKDVTKVTANPPASVAAPSAPTAADASKVADAPKAVAAPAAAVPAGAFVIDAGASKIGFVGSKKVGGSHEGGFKTFSGSVELVAGKPEVQKIHVQIVTDSIFSDAAKLTDHLKNQDFFEVSKFPAAEFVTTEIKAGGDKGASHTLVGNLTLHGVTKSISIPAVVKVEGDKITITSEFAINKNDFGMTFAGPGGVIREDVVIKLDVKAAKKS